MTRKPRAHTELLGKYLRPPGRFPAGAVHVARMTHHHFAGFKAARSLCNFVEKAPGVPFGDSFYRRGQKTARIGNRQPRAHEAEIHAQYFQAAASP